MNIKIQKAFIKNYIKNTHTEKDFKDLETFSDKEIREIYMDIWNYEQLK